MKTNIFNSIKTLYLIEESSHSGENRDGTVIGVLISHRCFLGSIWGSSFLACSVFFFFFFFLVLLHSALCSQNPVALLAVVPLQ